MKKMKKINIFIVPHNPNEKQKKLNIHLYFLFFFFIILIGFSIFTYVNLTRYIDTSSIDLLENDNRSLKNYIQKLESELPLLTQNVDSLRKVQKEIMDKYKFLVSGEYQSNIPDNIDSIIEYVNKMMNTFENAKEEILNNSNFYPSICPVSGWIVRKFGKAYDYHTERWKPFNGIGIAGKSEEPVVATAYGLVEKIGNNKEMGNYIVINHNNLFKTTYAHLGKIIVTQGQNVKRGQVIGKLGKTGKIPYPILYYEIKKGEKFLNPEDFILEEI